jgi:hypothetical protein
VRIVAATLAALALGLAACGTINNCACVASPISPRPTPILSPGPGFDVLINDSDRAVSVRVGQRIEVALTQRDGMTPWGPIRVDQPEVLAPVPTGIVALRGITVAAFVARLAGSVSITSTAGPQCPPNQACPAYAVLFSVNVTVT